MHDNPHKEPLEGSSMFADGRASRPLIPGTIARGQLHQDRHLHTGKVDGQWVDQFPFPITSDDLDRGQQRYNIFCAPCHDPVGEGNGMIVKRGFRPPPSLHLERLRTAPAGRYFDVITNGFGVMYSYADRIEVEDRWRIVAYIRALQLSQYATEDNLPAEEWAKLQELPE